ncbi:MAG: NAD-dependent epimerase/dehydratase family protein [Flavobacteriales bacterium]|nr:NAD-dependent epimerase/dehydratase family protein [Flavobacteriales bacterium]
MDLVSGITGLVGSHVALELLAEGRTVHGLVRQGSDRDIVRKVFNHYRRDGNALFDRIVWAESDLLDAIALREAMSGAERVFHCAAMVSFDPRDAKRMFATNINGTANVVNAALECGVRKLVHVSSTAATGRSDHGEPVNEDMPWKRGKHTSPYAVSKYESEMEVHRGVAEGLDAVMVNPSVVYGAGATGRGSLAVISRVSKGTSFYPTGSNGLVDARDVAAAMLIAADRGVTGERYILSTEPISYLTLFTTIAEANGQRPPTKAIPSWVLGLAWRAEAFRTTLTGGRSLVTRYTAHSALQHYSYDTSRAQALGITFRDPLETIQSAVAFYKSLL